MARAKLYTMIDEGGHGLRSATSINSAKTLKQFWDFISYDA